MGAGDLTALPDDREAFKQHLRQRYPEESERWVANAAGQLLRFRHTMRPGELVAYPQKSDRTINVGVIAGEYRHDPGGSARYPHRREVEWRAMAPREAFPPRCLHALGASMTVFTVSEHRAELLDVLGLRALDFEGAIAP